MNLTQCRMARAALDLGVRELAELAGVSPDTVSRFETRGADSRQNGRGSSDRIGRARRGIHHGGQPGVRMRPIDLTAIDNATWSPWKFAPSEADAVIKIRREWPGLLGQSLTSDGPLFFFAPSTEIRVAEAQPGEMGGSWDYRTKQRIFIPKSDERKPVNATPVWWTVTPDDPDQADEHLAGQKMIGLSQVWLACRLSCVRL